MFQEKCVCCNGTGKQQTFNHQTKKWTYENNILCKECNGTGIRKFYMITNGTDFLKKKIYI